MKVLADMLSPLRNISIPRPNASVLLFLSAVVAMLVANSPLSGYYDELLHLPVEVKILGHQLFSHHGHVMEFGQFVNDALMAIFFFLVGLEIKQEMIVGALSSFKRALLPIVAALGGMIVPVLCFWLVCPGEPESIGAAIPMATDIAFALAVVGALGSRVPSALRVFLMALAVVDDIGGIAIIAIFYSGSISWMPLVYSAGVLALIYVLGLLGVGRKAVYYALGIAVWYLFLCSGIHPTIAGVLVALCVPMTTRVRVEQIEESMAEHFVALPRSGHRESDGALVLSEHQLEVAGKLQDILTQAVSPVQSIEHALSPIVSYIILPLFAFVNAGVSFVGISSEGLLGVPLAILLGLFLGKALGITTFTFSTIKLGICEWPEGMRLRNLIPLSFFGGIGFTVSLFIATLSYGIAGYDDLLNQAKLGIFSGTILSGLLGYCYLRAVLPKKDVDSLASHL